MKKALYFFIYIIFTFPLGAESVELYAFTDVMALKSVMPQQIYGAIGFGATLNEDIAIEIPVKFLIDSTGGDEAILDTSVHLLIYPWEKGPYISLSLIQLITFIGSFTPQEPFHYLNEISIGYRWNFFNILSISPKITIRDPNQIYQQSYEYIHGFIPSFSKVDLSLNFQVTLSKITFK